MRPPPAAAAMLWGGLTAVNGSNGSNGSNGNGACKEQPCPESLAAAPHWEAARCPLPQDVLPGCLREASLVS